MLLEVKISDQYLNILSILRGKSVNSQYQYLEGRESIFLMSLNWGAGADGIGRRGNVVKSHEEGGDLDRLWRTRHQTTQGRRR